MALITDFNKGITGIFMLLLLWFGSVTYSVFSAKPPYNPIAVAPGIDSAMGSWKAVYLKKANPLDKLQQFTPESHEAKMVFRLTIPVLMRLFSLDAAGVMKLQIVIGVLTHLLFVLIVFGLTNNYGITLMAGISMASVYFGRSYFIAAAPFFDSFAYFLMLLAIYFRRYVWLLFPILIGLFFVDERAALSILVVAIVFKAVKHQNLDEITIKDWFSVNAEIVVLLLSLAIAVVMRIVLSVKYGLTTPTAGADVARFVQNWKFVQLGLWTGLEAYWILFIALLVYLFAAKRYATVLIVGSVILLFTALSAMVDDMTRSISYLVPLAFVAIQFFKNKPQFNMLMMIVLIGNMLYPASVVMADHTLYFHSFGFELLFKALHVLKLT